MAAEIEYPDTPYPALRRGPREFFEYGYLNRILYPEFEGVRQVLRSNQGLEKAQEYMRTMVATCIEVREKAIAYWEQQPGGEKMVRQWQRASLFDLIARPAGQERIRKSRRKFLQLLKEAEKAVRN